MKPSTRWILISTLSLLSLSACQNEQDNTKAMIRPVKAITIQAPQSSLIRSFPGVTLATQEATLSFQIAGQIIEFPVLEGTQVNKDTVVAKLDASIYTDKVKETDAILVRDKSHYERAKELVKNGHLSQSDYDKVKSNFLVAEANHSTALNNLKNAQLIAPFNGIVVKKYVKNFEYITAKQPIVLIQDTNNIDIEINVPENLILNLKNNQIDKEKMIATFDAIPKQQFPLSIKEFSSQADPQTQTFRAVFSMQKPKEFNILPGMTASVQITFKHPINSSTYLIPASSVFMSNDQPSIWLIEPKTMSLKKIPVKTSHLVDDKIEILSGLNSGDQIVISGVNYLTEGQVVSILK